MDQQETDKLVGQLFAVITGLFEDGAGLAMEGQVPRGKDIISSNMVGSAGSPTA
jgi:hypothetical protein